MKNISRKAYYALVTLKTFILILDVDYILVSFSLLTCDIFWERTLDKHDIAFGLILVFDTKRNKN